MAEKKLYEGMFLVDSARAASDWDGVNTAIKKVLDRAGAEIVSIRKWDDRRLAYAVKGISRGMYMLCYFKAEGREIQSIEKAVQLSETILRVLILSTEQMTKEDIEKDTPATKLEKEKEKAGEKQPQEAEVSELSDQQEEPAAEQAPISYEALTAEQAPASYEALTTEQARIVDEAETAEDVEQAGQTGQAEETGKPEENKETEDTGQAEEMEAEEPQDSQPKVSSDD